MHSYNRLRNGGKFYNRAQATANVEQPTLGHGEHKRQRAENGTATKASCNLLPVAFGWLQHEHEFQFDVGLSAKWCVKRKRD